MNANGRKHNPQLTTFLRLLQCVAILGVLYCVPLIVNSQTGGPTWRLLLYVTWFATAAVSAEAILQWFKAGVYILAGMTFVVGMADILSGFAALGGLTLTLLLVFVIAEYIFPEWWQFE